MGPDQFDIAKYFLAKTDEDVGDTLFHNVSASISWLLFNPGHNLPKVLVVIF